MSVSRLLSQIKKDTEIWRSPIHGLSHWQRVLENGALICEADGGDIDIITYFSYLHDSCRWNEDHDPSHGPRAAAYAKRHRDLFDLDDGQFKLLISACSGHTFSKPGNKAAMDKTLAACWDADRLDLPRVGVTPTPNLLFTKFGKLVSSMDN